MEPVRSRKEISQCNSIDEAVGQLLGVLLTTLTSFQSHDPEYSQPKPMHRLFSHTQIQHKRKAEVHTIVADTMYYFMQKKRDLLWTLLIKELQTIPEAMLSILLLLYGYVHFNVIKRNCLQQCRYCIHKNVQKCIASDQIVNLCLEKWTPKYIKILL